MNGLYSGIERDVKCGKYYLLSNEHGNEAQLRPHSITFNSRTDWILDKVVDQSHCEVSIGNIWVTDFFPQIQ